MSQSEYIIENNKLSNLAHIEPYTINYRDLIGRYQTNLCFGRPEQPEQPRLTWEQFQIYAGRLYAKGDMSLSTYMAVMGQSPEPAVPAVPEDVSVLGATNAKKEVTVLEDLDSPFDFLEI